MSGSKNFWSNPSSKNRSSSGKRPSDPRRRSGIRWGPLTPRTTTDTPSTTIQPSIHRGPFPSSSTSSGVTAASSSKSNNLIPAVATGSDSPPVTTIDTDDDSEAWRLTGVCQMDVRSGKPKRGLSNVDVETGKRKEDLECEDEDRTMIKLDTGKMLYNCKNCVKTFVERISYVNHLSAHVKCEKEGCRFEAIPTLVTKHYMHEHVKKQAFRTQAAAEAEARAWIEERRVSFPTKIRTKEKEDTEKDRLERGEVLVGQNAFGRFQITESTAFKSSVKDESEEPEKRLRMEDLVPGQRVVRVEDDDMDVVIDWNEKEDISKQPEKIKTILDEAKFLPVRQPVKNKPISQIYYQGSFLEKLLQPEIRHERNVLLQCIRYIIDCQYFLPLDQLRPEELPIKAEPGEEEEEEEEEEGEIDEESATVEELRAVQQTFSVCDLLKMHNIIKPDTETPATEELKTVSEPIGEHTAEAPGVTPVEEKPKTQDEKKPQQEQSPAANPDRFEEDYDLEDGEQAEQGAALEGDDIDPADEAEALFLEIEKQYNL